MGLLDFLSKPEVNAALHLAVVVILVIVLYRILLLKQERLRTLSWSAGADQRSTQQEFSGTNQRPYETGYNMDILQAFPFPDEKEHFNGRREHARNNQIPPSQAQEEVLAAQLYREHLAPDAMVKDELQTARVYSD